MVVGMIGATIAPWMQFYLQAAVVEKGVQEKQYAGSRLEVIVGSIFAVVVVFFIMLACAATLFASGHTDIKDAADALVLSINDQFDAFECECRMPVMCSHTGYVVAGLCDKSLEIHKEPETPECSLVADPDNGVLHTMCKQVVYGSFHCKSCDLAFSAGNFVMAPGLSVGGEHPGLIANINLSK